MGGCIGGPYCFGVIEAAPERVASAVLQQSIGSDVANRDRFFGIFDGWAEEMKASMPSVPEDAWTSFRANLFDREFVYNVSRDFVAACETPLLVLMGTDPVHPEVISRQIAHLAPNARLVEHWKDPVADSTVSTVLDFLREHTPG